MKKFHVFIPCGEVNIPLGIIYCDIVTKYPGAVVFSKGCKVVATLCGVEVEELEEREGTL